MRKIRFWALIFGALLLFGLMRLPMERSIEASATSARLHTETPGLGMREQLGQLAYVAALGGFRSLVAAFLWIDAHTAWEQTAWGRMAGLFQTVTSLQPHSIPYWDLSAWHMAWNAAIAARNNPAEPSEYLRMRSEREYQQLGRKFLEQGIANNPDNYQLYERLGTLLRDKILDHCAAADAFAKAATFPDAPSYVLRFAAYEMAECPDRRHEAYELLRLIYAKGEKERVPHVISLINKLEAELDIPVSRRLAPSHPTSLPFPDHASPDSPPHTH